MRSEVRVNLAWAGYAGSISAGIRREAATPHSAHRTSPFRPGSKSGGSPSRNPIRWGRALELAHVRPPSPPQSAFRFDELSWAGTPALASANNCQVGSVWDATELGSFSGGYSWMSGGPGTSKTWRQCENETACPLLNSTDEVQLIIVSGCSGLGNGERS